MAAKALAKTQPQDGAYTVEIWPLHEVLPYEKNARKIPEAAILKVSKSLQEFGWRQPMVVDPKGVLIVGHTRRLAALHLGWAEGPVHVANNLTPAQVRAYRLMDNRSHQESDWDLDFLKPELLELSGLDIDLSLTGFDEKELLGLLPNTFEGLTDEDECPGAPEVPATRTGDLWILGQHRLLCGDSTSIDAVERLMDRQKADMVFTDPPYGINFQSGRSKGGTATRFDPLLNDDQILDIAPIVMSFLRKDGAAYIWTAQKVYPKWRSQFAEIYKSTIIWHKPGGGIGDLASDYAADYEMCLFCVKGRPRFRNKRGMAVWRVSKDQVLEYKHPTQKPVELAERAIGDFSDAGHSILDLFGGSGSTLIACEKTGRDARLMELDPKYCDVIVNRWQNFTGQSATLEGDGRKFAEIKSERFLIQLGAEDAIKEEILEG